METDHVFPGNWKEIVREKKVIYYNTSVGNMLSGKEKHIEKMKWVFSIFQEHPEVVLWWRPHPLELATIKSMLPGLVQQYVEMRTLYQEKKTGILDESTDLHRAIAVSDAYYGDWSSVMHLYKVTGKPVMLSNDSVTEYSSEILFSVCDFFLMEDSMWFVSEFCGGLFRMNVKTFTVDEVVKIPVGSVYDQQGGKMILKAGSELILIPRHGNILISYHLETKRIRKINIGNSNILYACSEAFYKSRHLYLRSEKLKQYLRIDMQSMKIQSGSDQDLKRDGFCDVKESGRDGRYTAVRRCGDMIYAFSSIKNVWEITDEKTKKGFTKKMSVSQDVKENLNHALYHFPEDKEEPVKADSFFAYEEKWAYTLPEYINAILRLDSSAVRSRAELCGKKIYNKIADL